MHTRSLPLTTYEQLFTSLYTKLLFACLLASHDSGGTKHGHK